MQMEKKKPCGVVLLLLQGWVSTARREDLAHRDFKER